MVNSQGITNPVWVRWFDAMSGVYDDVRQIPDKIFTVDTTLTTADFGKTITFDCTSFDLECTLMPVTTKDLYCWIKIFRRGLNRLTINAPEGVRIEYSKEGGKVWCLETLRYAANLTLMLVTATQFGITGATGIWYVQ